MAIVGGMVEGSLTRTITNVKVTMVRDQDFCEGEENRKREKGREKEGVREGGGGRRKGEIEIMSLDYSMGLFNRV
jgi:hypothetical protein